MQTHKKHPLLNALLSAFAVITIAFGFSSTLLAEPAPAQGDAKHSIIEQLININRANAEQISTALKGVGLKKAVAIVEWREANGEFTSIEQLLDVKGIGEKTLAINREKIKI